VPLLIYEMDSSEIYYTNYVNSSLNSF